MNSRENGNLIDADAQIFTILDLVQLNLTGPWRWYGKEIDEASAKGSIFRTWGKGNEQGLDKAYICVADVSDDIREPDISVIDSNDLDCVDEKLQANAAADVKLKGMELVKWASSQLNVTDDLQVLVSSFIVLEQERERQFIVLRTFTKGRKLAIVGCFDIAEAETFSKPIHLALKDAVILS